MTFSGLPVVLRTGGMNQCHWNKIGCRPNHYKVPRSSNDSSNVISQDYWLPQLDHGVGRSGLFFQIKSWLMASSLSCAYRSSSVGWVHVLTMSVGLLLHLRHGPHFKSSEFSVSQSQYRGFGHLDNPSALACFLPARYSTEKSKAESTSIQRAILPFGSHKLNNHFSHVQN